jgi:hypothetical protein
MLRNAVRAAGPALRRTSSVMSETTVLLRLLGCASDARSAEVSCAVSGGSFAVSGGVVESLPRPK